MSDELGVLLVCLFFLDFIYVCATLGYRAVYSTYSLIFLLCFIFYGISWTYLTLQ
jgi:high-affinity Fe2+/Pb2+ permease